MSLAAPRLPFCEPRKHSGLTQTPYNWGATLFNAAASGEVAALDETLVWEWSAVLE